MTDEQVPQCGLTHRDVVGDLVEDDRLRSVDAITTDLDGTPQAERLVR